MTVPTVIAGQVKHLRTTVDGGGLLDPKDALKSLFMRGKVPVRGSIGVSVDHRSQKKAFLRSIAADATGDTDNALYDPGQKVTHYTCNV